MLGKARKKEQVSTLNTPGSISGEIDMTFAERLSARTGLKLKALKIIGIATIALPVLVAGGILVGYQLNQNRTVLSVGTYKINQKTYDKLISQAATVNQNRGVARQAIIESMAARAAADKLNIEYPRDRDTLNEVATELGLGPKNSDYQREIAYTSMIKNYVTMHEKGGSRAAIVSFPFSRYLIGGWDYGDKDVYDPAKVGNVDAVKQDISYAKQKAEQYRSAYLGKSKSPSTIVQEVSSDKRLNYGQMGNSTDFIFLADDGSVESASGSHIIAPDLAAVIKNTGQTNASDIQEELLSYKTKFADVARGNKMAAAYYFVIIDKRFDKRAGISGQFAHTFKEYKRA